MQRRWGWIVVAGALLVGCGSSGGDAEGTTTSQAAEPTTTTTTEPEVDVEAAAAELEDLIDAAVEAIDDEALDRDFYAERNDLDGAIDSAAGLRDELATFDEGLREVEVPDEDVPAINEVLRANGAYIEALDGYASVTEVSEYNDQLDVEFEAQGEWFDAAEALAEEMELDVSIAASDDAEEPSDDDSVADSFGPGETAATGTMSIEVPEGFTATAAATIEMEGEAGERLGIYNVFPDDSATTLQEVAEASATGAAEKNEFEITGGPEPIEVGDGEGIAYYFDHGDGDVGVSIYFEGEDSAGTRWHVISLEGPEGAMEESYAALQEVLPTVTVL